MSFRFLLHIIAGLQTLETTTAIDSSPEPSYPLTPQSAATCSDAELIQLLEEVLEQSTPLSFFVDTVGDSQAKRQMNMLGSPGNSGAPDNQPGQGVSKLQKREQSNEDAFFYLSTGWMSPQLQQQADNHLKAVTDQVSPLIQL